MSMIRSCTLLSCAQVGLSSLVQGFDISNYNPHVNWASVKATGLTFVYIKATEGLKMVSSTFNTQYLGATHTRFIRGAYHVALPDKSSGAAQATHFLSYGGVWTADGITLPGALELERNPYGNPCYGLSPASMIIWIRDFSNTYHARTGRYPVISTSTNWWKACTNDNPSFGNTNPLWIISYSPSPRPLPNGWTNNVFWQYADKGPVPGYPDAWMSSIDNLQRFARG